MLETKDLTLDKGKIEDWKALYENVWKQGDCQIYDVEHIAYRERGIRDDQKLP